MKQSTTVCILIDKSSPLWEDIQNLLQNGDTEFAECRDVTLKLVAENRVSDLEKEISEFLQYIGVPTRVYGFQYLVTAVELAYNDNFLLHRITKDLYPILAKRYRTTVCRVERNIRDAIAQTWVKENEKVLRSVFKHIPRSKPCNSEFIALVVCYIEYHRLTNTGMQ